jgi:exopolysaccharide production protein ExoY
MKSLKSFSDVRFGLHPTAALAPVNANRRRVPDPKAARGPAWNSPLSRSVRMPFEAIGLDVTPLWALLLGLSADALRGFDDSRRRPTVDERRRRALAVHALGGGPKRLLDIATATVALVILSPALLMVSALVRVLDGGPVLIAHQRVGYRGKLFGCLKFRTMVTNGDEVLKQHLADNPDAAREWEEARKLKDDPRVTSLGRVLRKTSLDELPQFLNVLRGEMSCVGPRPIVVAELTKYDWQARHYLRTRPGLTGIWQVSGRSSTTYRMRVAMDTLYVRRWSLGLDIRLLAMTIPALLKLNDAA